MLRVADKFGEARSGFGDGRAAGTLLELPLTRSDLAGITGSTPESVSRVMSRLRREGIIDSGRRWTAVLDRERLAEIAEPR
ncbi:helix-turn-helix domain-containing protein [Dietzia cinnamea]|nr:helix-turn-helix domain-containing protein [Dietzia cinnamea]MCT2032645.1 helix-turn-helix domain-containing protein [Dietzia cinnamea]